MTRFTALLALSSADETEVPLTWTPMDSTSWFGVPVTVPVPVTVMRALAEEEEAARTAGLLPDAAGAALLQPPSASAPVSAAAIPPPAITRRER